MGHKKINLDDALTGKVTEIPPIDWNSRENKRYIRKLIADRDRREASKDFNWNRIGNFMIGPNPGRRKYRPSLGKRIVLYFKKLFYSD